MTKVQQQVVGLKFKFLTIIEDLGTRNKGLRRVRATCECGVIKDYYLSNIKNKNHTTSCGCQKKKIVKTANLTHGLTSHPLYKAWGAMKRRCYNSSASDYVRYGGRGVKVCDEWINDFRAYYDWAILNGWKRGLNIDKDRKGRNLIYSPDTCSIVTPKDNQNHRGNNIIVEYNGARMTLKQVAEQSNVKYILLWKRVVKLKWDLQRSVDTPARKVSKI